MRVTIVGIRYVTPAQINTTNKPKGAYVDLKMTIQNVGTSTAEYSSYGQITWQDASTAAQDATTLEGIGAGPDLDATYRPGQGVTGDVILDVLHKGGVLAYSDDPYSGVDSFVVKVPPA